MRRDACAIPESVERMLASGARTFYADADREGEPGTRYFDLLAGGYVDLEPRPGMIVLGDLKRARGVVKSNPGASLVDLGDGVLCLEFHSKMNALGDDIVQMVACALDETGRRFRGAGDRQRRRELQRRRQPDDGAAGRAGRRLG